MFEGAEEVKRAMLDLKIFEAGEKVTIEEDEDLEYQEEPTDILPQIFPSHSAQTDRFCKTLYYGKLPTSDRPSLPFTQLAVDQFTNVGLDALGEKLGRLDMARAADISRNACAGPNSLVLSLLYLDKLRKRNPDYLTTVSSADLFLVSLMVASKFLHDDGEEDEVFNDEWASSGGIDTKELNRLELSFLSALDWRIYVDNQEFETAVEKVETDIAFKEVSERGWASYTDLDVLSQNTEIQNLWSIFFSYTMKMTAVCVTAYAAGLLSLLGTAALLNKTPVGPAAVSSSFRTLAASLSSGHDNQDTLDQVPDYNDLANDSAHAHVTPADLITASLLVASLSAGVSPLANIDLEDGNIVKNDTTEKSYEGGTEDLNKNQTQAVWLAEYSKQEQRTSPGWDKTPPDQGGVYDHPWIQGHSGYVTGDHFLGHGGGTAETDGEIPPEKMNNRNIICYDMLGLTDNLDQMVARWSRLMEEQKPDSISSYLDRCPVLKWSSSWRHSGWMLDTVSWMQIRG
eukprot:GFUD01132960.1.p1 GENE.GFUD01132960.1~~GFUD01132960.1.p1  ORF type:complete len:513 (+),score=194.21 GFUD01132960.1:90-1628(+)